MQLRLDHSPDMEAEDLKQLVSLAYDFPGLSHPVGNDDKTFEAGRRPIHELDEQTRNPL